MSQDNLGKLVGIGQGHVAKLESGKHDPRLSTVERMVDALSYEIVLVPKGSDILEESKRLRNKINRAVAELSR